MVTLDKGTDDGIEQGDVVIVRGGALAGRVTDVGPNFAKVDAHQRQHLDGRRPAPVRGKTGEIVGQPGGVLIMKNIDSSAEIGTNEEVFTPGLELNGGIRSPYPKGLVIGSVVDVQRDANDVVQTAFLAPAADLDAFEVALVITDYDGGLPPADEQAVPCGSNGTVPEGEVPCHTPAPQPAASPKKSAAGGQAPPCYALPMKGLVLAGGTATRLFPLTIVTNKHLLPIYDRPMIYYPLDTLAGMGIREVMVIVGGKSVGDIVELLGDGRHFGLDLTYRYQRGALGIAHAIGLARDFIGDDGVLRASSATTSCAGRRSRTTADDFDGGTWGAGTLLYRVPDPERFGVAELDGDGNVVGFEEKPAQPEERPDPDRRVLPSPRRVRGHRAPRAVGPRRVRDHRRAQPLHPRAAACSRRVYEGQWADAGTVPSLAARRRSPRETDADGRDADPAARRTPTADDGRARTRRAISWSPVAPGSSAASWSARSSAAATVPA